MNPSKGFFSSLRVFFWPIHAHEFKKFIPLLLMAFFIGFNYNILRNMKEALLVTAESSGAEVIPFIKVWGIVPGAILLTFIYSRLNNHLSRDKVFYSMVGIFLGFFAIFTFILYPLADYLHPHQSANYLQTILPPGFKGMIAMFRYWTFSSFYIMSELWSSTILSMLFWGFANEVTRLGEAKRFYGVIAISLNIAAIVSGQVSYLLTGPWCRSWSILENPWHQSVILLTAVVLGSGCAILALYRYLTKQVFLQEAQQNSTEQGGRIKMSMRENFAYLLRSKYLLYIAVIVLAYNIGINLLEVIWKDQVRRFNPDPNDYNAYMSQITTITGVISLIASLFISWQVIRKYGWTLTALLTPIIFLVTSCAFFFCFFGRDYLVGTLALLGTSPLALAVFFGSLQNCLCRSAKFTLYDPTKEMAFIPLSMESKRKGKAAIDGVGSRLGKSGGSFIHQTLLVIFSSIAASAHIVAGILLVVIVLWLGAVLSLGKQFASLSSRIQEGETVPEATPVPEKSKPALQTTI